MIEVDSKIVRPSAVEVRLLELVKTRDVDKIKEINKNLFPVMYSEHFYKRIENDPNYHNYLIIYDEKEIGICSYRIESGEAYLMTIGIFQENRGQGIGSLVLREIEGTIEDDSIREIKLHVHISNLRAQEFYMKNRYYIKETISEYYYEIYPRDAYLMVKQIN